MNQKQSVFIKWSFIIGIVIVLNLFFNYAASLIFSEPQYDQFCKQEQIVKQVYDQNTCLNEGGQWTGYAVPAIEKMPNGETLSVKGYCNPYFTCHQDYDTARKNYDRSIFITLVVLGVLCIGLSLFLKGNNVLGTALSFGGVLSLIIASMRYWSYADNILKVIILGVALVLLIVIAMRKFKDRDEAIRS
jgi:hypothetical protein